MSEDGNIKAGDDEVWVCLACGKTSNYRYGFHDTDNVICSRGWDESCMLNCALYKKDQLEYNDSLVVSIKEGAFPIKIVE